MTWRERAAIAWDLNGWGSVIVCSLAPIGLSVGLCLSSEYVSGVGACLVVLYAMLAIHAEPDGEWYGIARMLPTTGKDVGRLIWLLGVVLYPLWIAAFLFAGSLLWSLLRVTGVLPLYPARFESIPLLCLEGVAIVGTYMYFVARRSSLGCLTFAVVVGAAVLGWQVLPSSWTDFNLWRGLLLATGLVLAVASFRRWEVFASETWHTPRPTVDDDDEKEVRLPVTSHEALLVYGERILWSMLFSTLVYAAIALWLTFYVKREIRPVDAEVLATVGATLAAFLGILAWESTANTLRILRSLPISPCALLLRLAVDSLPAFVGVLLALVPWFLMLRLPSPPIFAATLAMAFGVLLLYQSVLLLRSPLLDLSGFVLAVALAIVSVPQGLLSAIERLGIGCLLGTVGLVTAYLVLTRSSAPYRKPIDELIAD